MEEEEEKEEEKEEGKCPGRRGGRAEDGGVGENGPRGVAARARVWTDGSPAWEPCSSCEKRKGTEGRGRAARAGAEENEEE